MRRQAPTQRPLGVCAALDALVSGIGIEVAAATSAASSRVATGCSASSMSKSSSAASVRFGRLDVPGAVGVNPDARLGPDRLPHRPHLADVVPSAQLELEGEKPSPAQPSAAAATLAGSRQSRWRCREAGAAGGGEGCSAAARLPLRSISAVRAAQRAGAERLATSLTRPRLVDRVAFPQALQLRHNLDNVPHLARRGEPPRRALQPIVGAQPQQRHLPPIQGPVAVT